MGSNKSKSPVGSPCYYYLHGDIKLIMSAPINPEIIQAFIKANEALCHSGRVGTNRNKYKHSGSVSSDATSTQTGATSNNEIFSREEALLLQKSFQCLKYNNDEVALQIFYELKMLNSAVEHFAKTCDDSHYFARNLGRLFLDDIESCLMHAKNTQEFSDFVDYWILLQESNHNVSPDFLKRMLEAISPVILAEIQRYHCHNYRGMAGDQHCDICQVWHKLFSAINNAFENSSSEVLF